MPRQIIKNILIFGFFSFLNLYKTQYVFSADSQKFQVSYDINYEVAQTGMTTVTQNVHLKNLTSEYYATEYASKIGTAKISNLRAYDKGGPLLVGSDKNGEEREVKIVFNDKIYGKGKVFNWTLVFESSEIAKKNGRIWEITIPKPSTFEDIADYNVTLRIPKTFGKALYIKPQPLGDPQDNITEFFWSKDQIKTSGISVAYGDYQLYKFKLQYHLKNSKLYPANTQIALPPQTQYQKIVIDSITPRPSDVFMDGDGNWLAKYNLKANEKKDIEVTGKAAVYIRPFETTKIDDAGIYKYSQKYWEATDPVIIKKARELGSPENIYKYVVNALTYDFNRVNSNLGRIGAIGALNNPQSAICMEFTDLFIALARAAGIPARQLSGFAYTQNELRQPLSLKKDLLHAWPEYFNEETGNWIMVDPTWGNTTGGIDYYNILDVNHLVLSINGQSSIEPSPAGTYKTEDNEKKDVEIIAIAEDFVEPDPAIGIDLKTNIPQNITGGLVTNGEITILNNGKTIFPASFVYITSSDLNIIPANVVLNGLPPYSNRIVPISLRPSNMGISGKSIINFAIGKKDFTYPLKIIPIYEQPIVYIIAAAALCFGVAIFIITKKSGSLFLSRRK